jgi:hypothetical protein
MILSMQRSAAFARPQAATVCAECGAQASGNFCSACGADLRPGALGVLGDVSAPVRRSFPAVYLKILSAPVRATVALAEDRAYRSHVSFLLSGIAIFCLLVVPILLSSAVPAAQSAHLSESMQTLMKVLSQVGVYVGAAITFVLAYALFRFFAKEPRSFTAYFKLYCVAFGFVMPLYAAYEFVARSLLGGTGMSSFNETGQHPVQWDSPSTLVSAALALVLWGYFIAIHRRFWHMSLWKAGALYVVAAITSYQLSFWLMYFVGYWTAAALVAVGVVSV